jgi:hypothetical protein
VKSLVRERRGALTPDSPDRRRWVFIRGLLRVDLGDLQQFAKKRIDISF